MLLLVHDQTMKALPPIRGLINKSRASFQKVVSCNRCYEVSERVLRKIMASRNYKNKTSGFGNVEARRVIRAEAQIQNRRRRRSVIYDQNRKFAEPTTSTSHDPNVQESNQSQEAKQTEDRRTKLLRWKAEKELQKKLQQRTKPPVFHTGIHHHKLNSPIFLHQILPAVKSSKAVTPRITRATAKRLAAKVTVPSSGKKLPLANKTSRIKKNTEIKKTAATAEIIHNSFAPKNHEFKAPEGLPNLPLFGHEAVQDAKTEPGIMPIYFSPYVVSARGKKASRREQLQNIKSEEYSPGSTRIEETDVQSTAISDDGEKLTTSYFRTITEKEVTRLKALCEHWTVIKTDDISEEAQLIINQAIGQMNLLICKKIEQFKQLISDCESGCGEKLVTCQDLQGFWEMMYMQIEDCDLRFNKLTRLQGRDWKEEEPEISKKIVAAKKPTASRRVIPSKSSSIKDMIRAARRKQMELQKTENSPETIVDQSGSHCPQATDESALLPAVRFDGGFFVVESPKKAVTPKSVSKQTPSRQPRPSTESNHRRSALNLLRISQLLKRPELKPVEVETDPTIPYVNSQRTPGKSILKQTESQDSNMSMKKSLNKVNFTKEKEALHNNITWSCESAKIVSDNAEMSPGSEVVPDAKKKLVLSDSDSEVEETLEDHRQKISETTCDRTVNPMGENVLNGNRNGNHRVSTERVTNKITKHAEIRLEKIDSCLGKENSIVVSNVIRSRCQGSLHTDNEKTITELPGNPVNESKEDCCERNFTTSEEHKENKKPGSPGITKRRRSTRKSVRFTGEDCTVCANIKPVLPMTPGANRRTSKQNTKAATPSKQSSADLISWDTPQDPPPRVRRSLRLQNAKQ